MDFVAEVVAPILFVGTLLVGIVGGATYGAIRWQHGLDKTSCEIFADQSGRETKFVDYNWGSWDCLTPQSDGKWISTSMLREV